MDDYVAVKKDNHQRSADDIERALKVNVVRAEMFQGRLAASITTQDSKNYREVEVLKSSGYLPGRKQVRYPRRHQALIRAQLERFWIYEELFRQHPASRIDDASHRRA